MPQESVNYAVGVLSLKQREAMDASRLERLLSASGYEEAKRTLSEIGWSSAEEADYEQMALDRVAQASTLVRSLSTDEKVTDCFLLKYDIANLKMLLKARCLGISADYLSQSGTLPVETLRHAVADHGYKMLPVPLCRAMEDLEQELLVEVDPLLIDVKLDRAMFELIFERLNKTRCPAAAAYFRGRVDLLNAITLLRLQRMGRDENFLDRVLLPGGTITEAAWHTAWADTEKLPGLVKSYGTKVEDAARLAVRDFNHLPGLEKAMDNALLAMFTQYKHDLMRFETIVGYLLAVEREASAVRLVMAGKQNGFDMDAIRERLRDLYG